jgi:branched-chain amino acid transport system ATP-binding protein
VTPVLEVESLALHFGGVQALGGVSFAVRAGEIFSLVGPNGSGKSSLLNCVNGFYRPSAGRIRFHGRDITALPSPAIARLGLARTFQNITLFRDMSVLDNILLGRHCRTRTGPFSGGLWFGPARREEMESRRFVEERIIDLLEIEDIRHEPVGRLPYGLQKRVDLGRALALEPTLLLLDEPTAGMNVEETEDMMRYLLLARRMCGLTMLFVEHKMDVVMEISDRVCVLNFGERIALGTPHEVQEHPRVVDVYLGPACEAVRT